MHSDAATTIASTPAERSALDALEMRFFSTVWNGIDPGSQTRHGFAVATFGPMQTCSVSDLASVPMLNLIQGAGEPGAVSGGHLAQAVEWMDSRGVSYYVALTPGLDETAQAEQWLRSHGFEQSYSWMKFVHDLHEIPELSTDADIRIAGPADGHAFGRIVQEGFGMPAWSICVGENLPGAPGNHCYLAEIDGEPVACAMMVGHDGMVELGLAATLEPARGHGCQGALLARRLNDAAQLGYRLALVETGERTGDRVSGSYRNILRAGFQEAYLRPNWQRANDAATRGKNLPEMVAT